MIKHKHIKGTKHFLKMCFLHKLATLGQCPEKVNYCELYKNYQEIIGSSNKKNFDPTFICLEVIPKTVKLHVE